MNTVHTWTAIAAVVITSTAGDVLISRAMKQVGHVGEVLRRRGLRGLLGMVLTNKTFLLALACMTLSFFSFLVALSWADASLVVPASASLAFVTTAVAAKLFLHETVDRRRWLAALLVCAGVAILAI
ncbi:MAG TPA: EamA family transporter [Terriglobales bacterium]|jgi:drug/metabolite transporter (DMT)-like permease|nr:EamA family transporter [Terriglobales bacterium]